MAPRRWFPGIVALAVVALLVPAPSSTAQRAGAGRAASPASVGFVTSPSPDEESQFVGRINGLRAAQGLPQLALSGELGGVARSWTEQMVTAGQLSHNPDLGSQVSGSWTKLGENVGVGYDVDGLMQAFVNSPAHNANLIDPAWTHVAVGVTIAADGRLYTTHNFMTLSGGPPPPVTTPPPPSAPTTAPPPVAAPVTPTTTPPPPAAPNPTEDRVTAVLDQLRSFEQG